MKQPSTTGPITLEHLHQLLSLKTRYEAWCGQLLSLFQGRYQRNICLYLDGLALQGYCERRGLQLEQCDPAQLRQEVLTSLIASSSQPVTADTLLEELEKVGPVHPAVTEIIRRDFAMMEPQLDREFGFATPGTLLLT